MLRKTLIATAAAAVLGTIGSFATVAPAKALPLSVAAQTQAQVDQSMVTPAKYKKRRHGGKRFRRGGRRHHFAKRKRFRHRPAVSFGFAIAPGFYYGSSFHPRFRVHSSAPYHCHKWRNRFGHGQRTCHRHH